MAGRGRATTLPAWMTTEQNKTALIGKSAVKFDVSASKKHPVDMEEDATTTNEVPEDTLVRVVQGCETGAVNVTRFTKDGNYCMTAGDDKSVRLYNPHKSQASGGSAKRSGISPDSIQPKEESALFIKAYSGIHGYPILDLAIADDKSKFVSAGEDRSFFLWDVTSGKVVRRIQGHTHKTNSIALNTDATVVITASYDQTVRCWDLRANNRDPIQTMSEFKDSVTSLSVTDHTIVAASVDGYIRTYDLRSGMMQADNLKDPITCVKMSDDRRSYLATCLGSNKPACLRLVDCASGQLLKEYQGHKHTGFKIEAGFENDHVHLLCGDEDGAIVHWNLLTGKVVAHTEKKRAHTKGVSSVAYHPSQHMFLTSSYDGSVKCWNSAVPERKDATPSVGSYSKRESASYFANR